MTCTLNILSYGLNIVVLLFGMLYLWMKYKHSYWAKRGVVTVPSSHWLFGHFNRIVALNKAPGYVLGDFYKEVDKKEKFFGMYILQKPFLLIRDPQLIKSLMIRDFDVFPNRYFSQRSPKDLASYNLFTALVPEWKHLRVKMTPLFTSGKIKKLFELMVESSESMRDYLEQRSKNNTVIETDVKEMYLKYTTDIISSLAFGIRTSSFGEPVSEFYTKSRADFKTSFKVLVIMVLSFFFPGINEIIGFKQLENSREYFSKLFWNSYENRQKSGKKRGDLIDYLIEIQNESKNTEFKFEGDLLLGQSLIFFVAGRETSTTTMCYALYELAKHPELQDKARKEIHEILKSEGLTYEGIQKMKYIQQVISETLRLYPPAPLLDRVASKDYVIPETNIVIEKGTPVYAVLTGIHLDPDNFPDPLRFDPDRFSDERKNEIGACTYMPFGDGPRVCIGLRVGMLQSTVGVVTVLKDYEVLLNPSSSYEPDVKNIFVTPGNKFALNLKRITANS